MSVLHIFDVDQTRENLAIQRLLTGHGLPLIPGVFDPLEHFGWNPANCWFALNIPTQRILAQPPRSAPGDIDIIGGPLEATSDEVWTEAMDWAAAQAPPLPGGPGSHRNWAWSRCIEQRLVKWPPNFEYATAAEVKAGRFRFGGRITSKTHRSAFQLSARRQARGVADLGFARVGLLYVLGGQPPDDLSTPGRPWFQAGASATMASESLERHILTEGGDPFATIVLTVSAVTPESEAIDGAMARGPAWHVGRSNPKVQENAAQALRNELSRNLAEVFARHQFDGCLPVLLLACRSSRCGSLYIAPRADPEAVCPDCGGPPTITARS